MSDRLQEIREPPDYVRKWEEDVDSDDPWYRDYYQVEDVDGIARWYRSQIAYLLAKIEAAEEMAEALSGDHEIGARVGRRPRHHTSSCSSCRALHRYRNAGGTDE